jgi:hypothetical protein
MRKINTDHTYEYNDVTGYVTNCFGDDMRGTDDHIDELNLLMGEIRALTAQRDKLAKAIEMHKQSLPVTPDYSDHQLWEALK